MSVVQIPVVKSKGFVEYETDALLPEVYLEALKLGLKELTNRKMSKITVAKLEGEELAKAQAAAQAQAEENAAAIMKGEIRFSGAKSATKVSGAVNTEAMRIARNMVKDVIKANKGKISHYAASEITKAAKELIANDPTILETAKANLEKRQAAPIKVDVLSLMKESPELIAKAEKAKAEKKTQLSAKQAGKVATRSKGAPASATLQ